MIPFLTFRGAVENLALVRQIEIKFPEEMYNTDGGTPNVTEDTDAMVVAYYTPDHSSLLFIGTLAQCREFIQNTFVKKGTL